MPKKRARKPDLRRFVQVAKRPSLGVEVTTGQAWMGIDQQVGHGSADALFALSDEKYVAMLATGWDPDGLASSCWRGERPDLLLFHPGGRSWEPENWHGSRTRMIPPRLAGEIWWHVDALGQPEHSSPVEISRALAAGKAMVSADSDGVRRLAFPLKGDGCCPRPGALIVGLTAGGSREQVAQVLGDPLSTDADVFPLEGDLVRVSYDEAGLAEIALERRAPATTPVGLLGGILAALSAQEQDAAYRAISEIAGGRSRRWAVSSGFPRRSIVFDGGFELQVEHTRVLSVLVRLRADDRGPAFDGIRSLFPDAGGEPTRDDVERVLGAPASTTANASLHRFAEGDLVVEYGLGAGGETPVRLTAVQRGLSVSHGIMRWRSGELFTFLDILGCPQDHPLVAHVRDLPGVRLRFQRGAVTAVEVGGHGYQTERFAAFLDGMPPQPTRTDVPLGAPHDDGDHDDLRYVEQGCIHVRSDDGVHVSAITVSQETPRGLDLHGRWGALMSSGERERDPR